MKEQKSDRFSKIDYVARRIYYDGDRREAFIAGVEYAYANPMDMWVSVEDALPLMLDASGLSENVLVCSDRNTIGIDCYDHNAKSWNAATENITHWMSLPALPKREEMYK